MIEVKMVMHQGSVLSSFAVVVDVVTALARDGVLSELLYADDLGLMSEAIEGLRDKFGKLKEVSERKGFKINHCKTNTKDGLSKTKHYPCGICRLMANANSFVYVQYGRLIHSRCAEVKCPKVVYVQYGRLIHSRCAEVKCPQSCVCTMW